MTENSSPKPTARHSPESLVKDAAREVGFSLAGIAGVSPSPGSGPAFERWIREGKHGEMTYLAGGADKRKNPGILLDGAKSIVCVAVNYYSRKKEQWNNKAAANGRGRVAIYAHGRDYHEVMAEMLEELERRLRESFPGLRARAVVDTEPISERDLALRAGIAWLGKNTCAISPVYGSWIFLGELVTDIPLEPGTPLESLCGTCTKCVDSCPTGALEEYVLDANKCISYLTVEKRGEIAGGFHRAIGENLFGCDECQRVCPFNKAARESLVFGGNDRNAIAGMRIEDLVDIFDGEFEDLARDTAIRRCKPEGLRRNARIVEGNRPSSRRGENTP
jgi:epoxyqueuosine reductase